LIGSEASTGRLKEWIRCGSDVTVLVIEVKSVVPDLQATLVVLDRKTRLGAEIARQRGWVARGVSRILVLADGRTTRRRVAEHEATFAATLPIEPSQRSAGCEPQRQARPSPGSGFWQMLAR
jgi:hypothetical protein